MKNNVKTLLTCWKEDLDTKIVYKDSGEAY